MHTKATCAAGHAQSLLGCCACVQVEQSLLPAKRHTSLKMLLHLDSYDFFSDVNVAEAQASAVYFCGWSDCVDGHGMKLLPSRAWDEAFPFMGKG
eukprot:1005808-Pelagomonas_calceolata.AAC.1